MGHDGVAGDVVNSPPPLKVFVMSHHLVVRAGLTMFICPERDLDLVGESGADSSAVPLLLVCAPDVVILDLDDIEGEVDLCTAVAKALPSARVILLTAARNAGRHTPLLRLGAVSLLLKEAPLQVVLKQLRRCERRGPPIAGALRFAAPVVWPAGADLHQRRIARLTDREREIVHLIGEGLRNEQIAVRLGISEKTVRNQLSSLFDKLGVNDRLGLAVYAFEHGLLLPPA
jgi:DNA-binding NarL/FixJ family response regulator